MEIAGVLTEMGYLYGGAPKGFSITDDVLRVWCKKEPWLQEEFISMGQRLLAHRLITTEGHVAWVDQDGLAFSVKVAREALVDIYIIGGNPDLVECERQRWTQRGYRVKLINAIVPGIHALTIDTRVSPIRYSGHLPGYPYSDCRLQAWH